LGAQAAVNAGDVRWLKAFPLWTGIVAGPLAWAFDLTASYASVKWACQAGSEAVLSLITIASLAAVAGAAAISWTALMQTSSEMPTDGGTPRQRRGSWPCSASRCVACLRSR